jgi:hypothetical protein
MDDGVGTKGVHGRIARLPRVLSGERGFTLIELLVVEGCCSARFRPRGSSEIRGSWQP